VHYNYVTVQARNEPIRISPMAEPSRARSNGRALSAAQVAKFATEIGERDVFRPHALRAAADHIPRESGGDGYVAADRTYRAGGVKSENLEVAITGR